MTMDQVLDRLFEPLDRLGIKVSVLRIETLAFMVPQRRSVDVMSAVSDAFVGGGMLHHPSLLGHHLRT